MLILVICVKFLAVTVGAMSVAADVRVPMGVAMPQVTDVKQADNLLYLCANLGRRTAVGTPGSCGAAAPYSNTTNH